MVYKNNIPQPGDSPATDSQADLLENFSQLNTQFSGDHVALTALANTGFHTRIRFEDVAAAPGLPDPMGSLYMALVGTDSELFFENFNNGTALNAQIQLTNLAIANVGNPGTALGTLYQVDLPIGITIYMGTTNAFSGNRTVVFPTAYTTIYSTTVTANDVNPQETSVAQVVGGLTIYTANSVQVNWTAIGTI